MADQSVDEDPEYENEADDDDDVELADVEPADPREIPPDEGDIGRLTEDG
jgi:hypothetical protein